jgi:hypothetical protein
MVGARMVLPGPFLDGENIYALMDTYKVTISTGVGGRVQETHVVLRPFSFAELHFAVHGC